MEDFSTPIIWGLEFSWPFGHTRGSNKWMQKIA